MDKLISYIKEHKVALAVIIAAIWMAEFSIISRPILNFFVVRVTFYCMLVLIICWALSLKRFLAAKKIDARSFIRRYGAGMLFSLALTACIFASIKPEFRVFYDETNLLGVSRSMVYEKKADNVIMGKWYYHTLHPLQRINEKRPYLFPFMVSLVHTAIGYRPTNPFVLNFVLLALLFFCVLWFMLQHFHPLIAYASVLLVAAQPVLSLSATSAGMDFMAVTFAFGAFLALREYLREPGEETFQFLWLTLLMVANIRYEGPLFLAIVVVGLLASRRMRLSDITPYLMSVTAIVLLPVFWQRCGLHTDYQNQPDVPAFALKHLIHQAPHFLRTLVDTDLFFPYAALVNIAGLAGGAYFLRSLWKRTWPKNEQDRTLAWISLAGLAAYWAVINLYYFSTPLYSTSSRFYGLLVFALSLLAAGSMGSIKFFRGREILAIALSVAVFVVYHPVSFENRFMNPFALPREYKHEMAFFNGLNDREILIIADWPGQFTAQNYGAVNFRYGQEHSWELLNELDKHIYSHIYALQAVDYQTGAPTGWTFLGANFKLKPVFEIRDRDDYYTRIVDVTRQ